MSHIAPIPSPDPPATRIAEALVHLHPEPPAAPAALMPPDALANALQPGFIENLFGHSSAALGTSHLL